MNTRENLQKNAALYAGLAIPLLMIFAIAAAIYLPRLWAPDPQYGFLYYSGADPYGYAYGYQVSDGKIIQVDYPSDPSLKNLPRRSPEIFRYDPATGRSKTISFEEARNLSLDGAPVSPDGYQIKSPGGGDFIFGSGGRDYNSRYLAGHGNSIKLNLQQPGFSYGYFDFRFLGWIIN